LVSSYSGQFLSALAMVAGRIWIFSALSLPITRTSTPTLRPLGDSGISQGGVKRSRVASNCSSPKSWMGSRYTG